MDYLEQLLIKFLLPFSLFFVLFVLPPLLSQSLKPLLMQYYFNFRIIDKSYMFLLFNVIVAFIVLYSTLINASSSTNHESIERAVNNDSGGRWLGYNASESKIEEPIIVETVTESESPEEEENNLVISHEPEKMMISDAKEEENSLMIVDEDHDTEELNKKCDDFIKKMKASFCSERRAYYFDYYQKSLVVVN